jgi:molybdopterin converting factor small subunit
MTEINTITVKVLCFGIARDITGASGISLHLRPRPGEPLSVADLREALLEAYPAFADLVSFALAKNEAYAQNDEPILATDTLAIIPPVSGG